MVDKSKTGVIRVESSFYSSAWRLVKNLSSCGLDRGIREAGWSVFHLAARKQTVWILFLCLVSVVARASAETGSPVPTMDTLITRMARARAENQASFRSYIVTRDYQLFGKEPDESKSQVIANVSFVPPDSRTYAIQQSMGSVLGEKVVRRMLAREADITKDCQSTDFSPDNYVFRFLRQEKVDNQNCYVLVLLPRRKDKNLLRGTIWVDANTYLLRRTEGEPAKPPSWWLRDLRLVFVYGEVGGMWLQTGSEGTANVRILGQYKMVSRDVKYQLSELVAADLLPVPGFDQKDIDLSVENNLLMLKAERKQPNEVKEQDWYAKSFRSGHFEQSWTLPRTVDPEEVSAEFTNGVLEIRVPRAEAAISRKIELKQLESVAA